MSLLVKLQKVVQHVKLLAKKHANAVWKDVRHARMLVKKHVRMINAMNARLPVRYVTLSKVIVPRINRGLLNT